MNKVEQIVERAFEDGYDVGQIMDFLCDGEAMAEFGITDEDQADVEEAFYKLKGQK